MLAFLEPSGVTIMPTSEIEKPKEKKSNEAKIKRWYDFEIEIQE